MTISVMMVGSEETVMSSMEGNDCVTVMDDCWTISSCVVCVCVCVCVCE